MAHFRLAHFSDIHFTLNPFAQLPESVRGKRIGGLASYYIGGRRSRFRDCGERIAALLDDVDHAGVDHAICTGDITSVSLDAEFEGLAKIFGARMNRPEKYTVLPGNHDRYVKEAVVARSFERSFSSLCPEKFPFSKKLGEGMRVVAIDVSRPTALIDSSGLCGPGQLASLTRMLAEDTRTATIVAMHYGLLRWRGNPDRLHHGMRDATEVLKALNESPARIAIILHGHMHGAFTVSSGRHPILCAGSAIDLMVDCGYFVCDIDTETLAVTLERREWNKSASRFETADATMLNDAVREKRGFTLDRRLLK